MNNRIRKLARQAGYSPLEPRAFADDLQEVFLQKFAELIVKDCSCVPTDMWGEGTLDVHTAVQVHRQILKHFGVKE
jgi:hypothetical protein